MTTTLRSIRDNLEFLLEYDGHEISDYGVTVTYSLGPVKLMYLASYDEFADELLKQSFITSYDKGQVTRTIPYTASWYPWYGEEVNSSDTMTEPLSEFLKSLSHDNWKSFIVSIEFDKSCNRIKENAFGSA